MINVKNFRGPDVKVTKILNLLSLSQPAAVLMKSFTEWHRTVHANKYTYQLVLGGVLMMFQQEIRFLIPHNGKTVSDVYNAYQRTTTWAAPGTAHHSMDIRHI